VLTVLVGREDAGGVGGELVGPGPEAAARPRRCCHPLHALTRRGPRALAARASDPLVKGALRYGRHGNLCVLHFRLANATASRAHQLGANDDQKTTQPNARTRVKSLNTKHQHARFLST
jgi:hypothetical protein